MWELFNDPFYEQIENYKNCIIDYCLIKDDTPHQGKRSHKDAILFAMLKVIERYINTGMRSGKHRIHRDMGRMIFAKLIQFCFRTERENLKYMNGRQTGQTILMTVMNGGGRHVGAYMISAWTDM